LILRNLLHDNLQKTTYRFDRPSSKTLLFISDQDEADSEQQACVDYVQTFQVFQSTACARLANKQMKY